MDRPTFEINEHPIRAAGITMYAWKNGVKYVMLMLRQHGNDYRYEDPGGKTDPVDISAEHVAARETSEETNGVLDRDELLHAAMRAPVYVSPQGKYASFYIQTEYNADLPGMFGSREALDGIERTYEWIETSHLPFINLNPRLGREWRDRLDHL